MSNDPQRTDDPIFELARRMPWAWAEEESWWHVTGAVHERHSFTDCIARVLPQMVTGSAVPLFEVLIYGSPMVVGADKITSAKRLVFVYADEPSRTLYDDEQDLVDAGVKTGYPTSESSERIDP